MTTFAFGCSVPPSDLTLEETKELMTDEGLIPDLPT